ncbi:MAG: hypothetical protein ACXQT2_03390, partial [Methanotrichaceae archaeon]
MQSVELFTPEDARALLEVIEVAGSRRSDLLGAVVVSVDEIDLGALASSLHGIMDPIGQLKDWLYDRLKELASWFADAVHSVFEAFWNSIVKPVVDSIKSAVDNVW